MSDKALSKLTEEARNRAAAFSGEDLQREMLAQLYVSQALSKKQLKELGTVTTYLVVLFLLGLVGGLASMFT